MCVKLLGLRDMCVKLIGFGDITPKNWTHVNESTLRY